MRVGLFIPCYVNQFYPEVGIATLELLERFDLEIIYPEEQTCCGQPLANSGMEQDAIPIYEHFIEVFSELDYVVAPSSSCVYHVRKHYDILEQTDTVVNVRNKTIDLVEFLVDVLKVENLSSRFPHQVGLHQSCHGLRGLRLAQSSERVLPHFSKWNQLLDKVEGLVLIELDYEDECCGFGGTFAVQEGAVSAKMGKDKIQDHVKNGAAYITSGDMSCLMHLDGIIRRNNYPIQVIHIAQILNAKN